MHQKATTLPTGRQTGVRSPSSAHSAGSRDWATNNATLRRVDPDTRQRISDRTAAHSSPDSELLADEAKRSCYRVKPDPCVVRATTSRTSTRCLSWRRGDAAHTYARHRRGGSERSPDGTKIRVLATWAGTPTLRDERRRDRRQRIRQTRAGTSTPAAERIPLPRAMRARRQLRS